ncbi:MAG: HIT family protein [Nanoarchaeota archaeon]|nr:HIT family protein [Nanoarchaeota archaeon]
MENPLSEAQIKELNEIVKLDKEEQQVRLQSFLSTLNQEQIEFLQKNQQRECLFCSLVQNKIKNYRIYEDEDFVVVLDIKGVNEGQCLLLPRKHVVFSFNVEEKIWNVINKVVLKLYEEYNCGTNIFIANGGEAGQVIGHFSVSIIPRFKDDKVVFNFIGGEINDEKLNELSEKLRIEEEVVEEKVEEIDYLDDEMVP